MSTLYKFFLGALLFFAFTTSALSEDVGIDQLNTKNQVAEKENEDWNVSSMNFDYFNKDLDPDDIITNMMLRLIGEPVAIILDTSFGINASGGGSPTAVTKAIITLSNIVVILSTLYIFVFVVFAIAMQAKTADYLGGKSQPLLVPMRNAAAVALVQPLPFFGGLNLVQVFVTILFLVGLSVANYVASQYIKTAFSEKLITPKNIPGNSGLLTDMFRFQSCTLIYNDREGNSNSKMKFYAVDPVITTTAPRSSNASSTKTVTHNFFYGTPVKNASDSSGWSGLIQRIRAFSHDDDLDSACGKISFTTSYPVSASGNAINPTDGDHASKIPALIKKYQKVLEPYAKRAVTAFLNDLDGEGTTGFNKFEASNKIAKLLVNLETELASTISRELDSETEQLFSNAVDDVKRGGMSLLGYFYWRIVDRQAVITKEYYDRVNTSNYITRTASETMLVPFESTSRTEEDKEADLVQEFNQSFAENLSAKISDPLPDDVFRYLNSWNVMTWYSSVFNTVFIEKNGDEIDPMMTIRHQGNVILSSYLLFHTVLTGVQAKLQMAKLAAEGVPFVGKVISVPAEGALSIIKSSMEKIAVTLGLLFTSGLVLAVVIPLLPFVMFTIGVVGLLIYYAEAMAGISFMILSLGSNEGNRAYGKANHGVAILFTLLFRPLLMVIGFILGISLFRITADFVLTLLPGAFLISTDSGTSLGVGTAIGYPIVSTALLLVLAYKSFQLTYEFPNLVYKHLGLNAHTDAGEMDSKAMILAMSAGQTASTIGQTTIQGGSKKDTPQTQSVGSQPTKDKLLSSPRDSR